MYEPASLNSSVLGQFVYLYFYLLGAYIFAAGFIEVNFPRVIQATQHLNLHKQGY